MEQYVKTKWEDVATVAEAKRVATDDVWYVHKIDADSFQLMNLYNNPVSLITGITSGSGWKMRTAGV